MTDTTPPLADDCCPFDRIALSLSGGGFRAASFHLGAMCYLEEIKLLEKVEILSTVSGGTFTGVCYTLALSNGGSFRACFDSLYHGMHNNLIKEALEKMAKGSYHKSKESHNLINAFAELYNDHFFGNAHFGQLWEPDKQPGHLQHVIFNSTEFNNGLYFRFQYSQHYPGIIGNYYLHVKDDAAKELRMADITAASSCFPGGFEPIVFPHDFTAFEGQPGTTPALDKMKTLPEWKNGVGLMDGGIVDNQGIRSVLLAMQREKEKNKTPQEFEKAIIEGEKPDTLSDYLFIISDVASPFMSAYVRPEKKKDGLLTSLRLKAAKTIGLILFMLGLSGIGLLAYLIYLLYNQSDGVDNRFYLIAGIGVLAALTIFVFIATLQQMWKAFRHALDDIPVVGNVSWDYLGKVRLGMYGWLIAQRFKSANILVSEVFLKQVRRLMYESVYQDKIFRKRRISNLLHDLVPEEVSRRTKKLSKIKEELRTDNPTLTDAQIEQMRTRLHELYQVPANLQIIAANALAMGTTLWFDNKDKQSHKLRDLITCGQFTMCFNIIEFILRDCFDKLELGDPAITAIYEAAMKDWKKFSEDPYWLARGYGVAIN